VQAISESVTSIARGDLPIKMNTNATGTLLTLQNDINTLVDMLDKLSRGIHTISTDISDGNLGTVIQEPSLRNGMWKNLVDNINSISSTVTEQIQTIDIVTRGISDGSFPVVKHDISSKGEFLKIQQTLNTTANNLSAFR
jgi:methyl-accepting chemotaxis protein